MSQANCVRVAYEDLRSINWATIAASPASYVAVGTELVNPVRILKIKNTTDVNLMISLNGLDDKDMIPTMTGDVMDYGANRAEPGGHLELPARGFIYTKPELDSITGLPAVPTEGYLYITVVYVSHN